MLSLQRARHAAASLLLVSASGAALAATPADGTLSLESGPIEFSNGPNMAANVAGVCSGTLPDCDDFSLTIDLPDNVVDFYPNVQARISIDWDSPTGQDDYDLVVYDSNGNEVVSSLTTNQPETGSIVAFGGVSSYTLEIIYWTAIGSTYTGTIELDLGEPAEGVDVDDFWQQNSVLAAMLKPEDSQQARSGYVERRSAGGALGGFMLGLLVLLGLRRARR